MSGLVALPRPSINIALTRFKQTSNNLYKPVPPALRPTSPIMSSKEPKPKPRSKPRDKDKDGDKSKVHKLSLKGSARLVAEFVRRASSSQRISIDGLEGLMLLLLFRDIFS